MGPFDSTGCRAPAYIGELCCETPIFGRGYLIVKQFGLGKVRKILNKYCENCKGEAWDDVAEKLSRNLFWEFEDYRPEG